MDAIYGAVRQFIGSKRLFKFNNETEQQYWDSYVKIEKPLVDFVKSKLNMNLQESISRILREEMNKEVKWLLRKLGDPDVMDDLDATVKSTAMFTNACVMTEYDFFDEVMENSVHNFINHWQELYEADDFLPIDDFVYDALAAVQLAMGLGATGQIGGLAWDALSGSPLSGVKLVAEHASGFRWQATTDEDGTYTATVAVGEFILEAEHPFYQDLSIDGVTVITDSLTTVDLAMIPRARCVYGTISDLDTGLPLLATVSAGNEAVGSDPGTGAYEIYLDAGAYAIQAQAQDHLPEIVSINLSPGEGRQLDFHLAAEVALGPNPIQVSLAWQGVTAVPITLTNRLPEAYDFHFFETGLLGIKQKRS